jgi:hypothetical protein
VAFGYDLVKQIVDERFSTGDYTVVEPFDNATDFETVVTEEFRTDTVVTFLASMGGLWIILNDLFSSLFG